MLDLGSVTVQLRLDQVMQLLDVLVTSIHGIYPRKLGCVVHKTDHILVALTALTVHKYSVFYREDVITVRTENLYNKQWCLINQ